MKVRRLHLILPILGLITLHTTSGWAQNSILFLNQNSFLGNGAGSQNTTGINNVFVGFNSGRNNTTGIGNVFLGSTAGQVNTTGVANVFVGAQAGAANTSGIGNLFLGQQAGANSNGSYNLFIGNGSGNGNTNGTGNTAIGDGSFYNNLSGLENTAIGRYAGINNTTGSRNTFIGVAATNPVGSGNLTNSTAIGFNAAVTASNSMILGNTQVNVGIGNTAPANKLEITKGAANQSGLRFTNLTSSSPASVTSQYKFLTVNAQGDVILGSLNTSTREGVADGFWQKNGTFLQNTEGEAVIIGNNVNRTPAGYKLFVEDGILTEKVKVAVKNTDQWSDKVFAPGYSLKSLGEVEQYIHKHQHLPNVPSAEQMVEQGMDVLTMNAKLLEKVEELTLYMIELKKDNQQLKNTVYSLQKENKKIKHILHSVTRSR
ncbi:hypothetical protein [Spirosoma daeguense]